MILLRLFTTKTRKENIESEIIYHQSTKTRKEIFYYEFNDLKKNEHKKVL